MLLSEAVCWQHWRRGKKGKQFTLLELYLANDRPQSAMAVFIVLFAVF